MRGYNSVVILGRLGADPEVRYMTNGTAHCSFTLATSKAWKDKNSGEDREQTEWHRCVVFGSTAEFVGKYARKGSILLVAGELTTRKWQDSSGQDRYTTEIKVGRNGEVQLVSGWAEDGSGGRSQPQARSSSPAPAEDDAFGDDIPF